jgi:hypothetical protein
MGLALLSIHRERVINIDELIESLALETRRVPFVL